MTVVVYIPDIPEFQPLLEAARAQAGCTVHPPCQGYWRVQAAEVFTLSRKPMRLGPALWNSMLSGGFRGRVVEYGRDELRIESEEVAA